MKETTEKEAKGGCPVCACNSPPIENCTSLNKKVSNPFLCMVCEDEYYLFRMPGHPDDGELMACGIMVENRQAGNALVSCPYFKHKTFHQVEVLDADECNKTLRLVRILKERKQPVIIDPPCYEYSPHEFLDKAILAGRVKEFERRREALP